MSTQTLSRPAHFADDVLVSEFVHAYVDGGIEIDGIAIGMDRYGDPFYGVEFFAGCEECHFTGQVAEGGCCDCEAGRVLYNMDGGDWDDPASY